MKCISASISIINGIRDLYPLYILIKTKYDKGSFKDIKSLCITFMNLIIHFYDQSLQGIWQHLNLKAVQQKYFTYSFILIEYSIGSLQKMILLQTSSKHKTDCFDD